MKKKPLAVLLCLTLAMIVVLTGCSKSRNTLGNSVKPIKVGYYGGTCEAAIYVARENGIFAKHGLNVELVKVANDTLKEGVGTGKIDVVQVSPALFKPIEQGLDIRISDGVHTGCIQAVVPVNSEIQSIRDLKGKSIGVESIGGVPMTLLSVELSKAGIDPKTEVGWKAYPGPQLLQAMEKEEMDIFATWDPFGELAVNSGKARVIFSTTSSPEYKDQYCCFVGISGKLAKDDPEAAQRLTAAFAEAGQWIKNNPAEAAEISIEKQYTSGDIQLTTRLLSEYTFVSDIQRAEQSLAAHFTSLQNQKVFDSATDPSELLRRVFLKL